MPRVVLVRNSTRSDDLATLNTARCKFFFIAVSTVNLLVSWDETFGADRRFTCHAAETFFMPLSRLVLHLLVAGSENFAATVTTGGELGVIARTAEDLVHF